MCQSMVGLLKCSCAFESKCHFNHLVGVPLPIKAHEFHHQPFGTPKIDSTTTTPGVGADTRDQRASGLCQTCAGRRKPPRHGWRGVFPTVQKWHFHDTSIWHFNGLSIRFHGFLAISWHISWHV